MKKRSTLLVLGISLLMGFTSIAQKQKVSDVQSFKSFIAPTNQRAADDVKEINLPDGRSFQFVINKIDQSSTATIYYGVLQPPLKGGVFLYQESEGFRGEIFQSDINKVTQFQTENGVVYLEDIDITKSICNTSAKQESLLESQGTESITEVPPAVDTRKLQSYPGAKAVVYIDFDGGWSGQRWANSYTSGVQFYATPANISSDNEYAIWQIMSEDYKPFDINITTDSTVFLQYATNRRQRLIVTRNASWQTLSSTGIGYVNGFSTGDDPCFSFPGGFSSANPMPTASAQKLGEVSSHEVGHTVGLSHDGTSATSYYSGQGNWAPIMGSGYNRNVTQWSKGEYADANQLQDDLAIITKTANGFGYKADDCGNTNATSKSIVIATGGVVNATDNNGVIEQSTDIDVFKFTTSGGTVTLHFGTATPKPNLDIKASLYNSSNQLVTSSDVANLTYADISTTLAAGTYYINIEGVGYGDPLSTGYSKYASLGYYEISGTIPSVVTNILPTVSITAPTTGTTFTAPATVAISANAADTDGTITKVEFYQGTTLLGSDATSPYAYSWTSVAAGTYSITAKATDNSGAVTTSTAISITVNPPANVVPTVSITAPATGATFTAPATVAISANAADTDGTITKVEFYQGTTLLGSDATSPYAFSWTSVVAGTYSITAKATDNSGAVTTSTAVSITVNPPANVVPTVSITAPATGATFTAPATVAISANAADTDGTITKVEFYQGTTLLGSDATSPYAFSWTSVAAGTYSITAKATDNSGAVTTSSAVSITVKAPNVVPTVSITAPATGATFTSPATVAITANATDSDGSIAKVEFYNGTALLGSDATSPYAYSWTSVAAGTYSITAKATDNSGAVTTSTAVSITVKAANGAPTVSISAPTTGATFTAPATVAISATATDPDGSITKVEFYNGTTLLGSDATSPYAYSWTSVAAGTYSITAKATDNSGAVTTSTAVSITVNPAQTGTEDCSNIAPWNSTSIYVNGDFVTYQNIKYKAKWWTKGNNPATTSGQYDVWQQIGECISGSASAGADINMTPANATTLTTNETLAINVTGLSSGSVSEVNYFIYKDTTRIALITKNGIDLSTEWQSALTGDYLLQVVVKDANGKLIYSAAREIAVSQTTWLNNDLQNTTLSIYPNPTSGIVHFNTEVKSVTITDLSGKVFDTILLKDNKLLDLTSYTSGVYLLQITNDADSRFVKIVKE